MNERRFEQIQEYFWRALDREPSARPGFFSELRARDADLADEVESLVDADAMAEGFFAGPPGDVLAVVERLRRMIADTDALQSALEGRYRIERELGQGGMSTVYLATDLRHDRRVALKVVRPDIRGSLAAERFQREIRIAGQLQHPHILPIFESGEAAGFLYYVMPFVEGETLAARLKRERQLPVDDALRITREVAEALEYAHGRGVVHRDIKPGNILLSGDHALIADFGIAKAVTAAGTDSVTETGITLGTPAYMSPEQATGQELDGRSDIYSLACVLYEMLAGSPPFTGANPRVVLARHAADDVPPLRSARPVVPAVVTAVIERALAKTPADRWSSATEFAAALEDANAAEGEERGWLPGIFTYPSVIVLLLLIGVAGAYVIVGNRDRITAPGQAVPQAADAIAVLPFEVRGTAPHEWGEGAVDLLSTALDGAGGLRAISSRTVLARWNELIADTVPVDEQLALEVGRRTGARYALLGSAVGLGSSVRLTARLYDLNDGRQLDRLQADGTGDQILAVMDRVAVLTLETVLRKEREDVPRVPLSNVITSSVPALKAYLEGESLLRRGQLPAAIQAFQDAVRIDSLFALAYYGLFRAASFGTGLNSPIRIDAREKAFELIDRLPEREAFLVRLSMEWKYPKPDADFPETVLKPLEQAVQKYPEDADIWHELAEARLEVLESVGSWETVREPLLRATELAPKFAPYWIKLIIFTLAHDGDSAVVAQRIANYESVSADARRVKLFRITADLSYGDSTHRAAAAARLDGLEPDELTQLLGYLKSPRRWEAFEQVAEAMYRKGTRADKDSAMVSLGKGAIIRRGRLRDGLRYLEDPILPGARVRSVLYWVSMHGIPVPVERIEASGPFNVERADREPAFLHGVYAADHGHWEEHRAAIARLHGLEDRLALAYAAALEARALWRRGQTEEALVALRDTLHDLPLNVYLWAGRMARETRRLELAARHYEHFMLWRVDPLVSYELGDTYDMLGARQRARDAYDLFVDAWAEADPQFQPLVETARRRLQELEGGS